jgi:uncharacterized membrane protein YcjF (UPF0283 family)
MYYAFAVLAAIIVLALIVLYVVREQAGLVRRHNEVHRELQSDHTPTLEYDVPTGQDPVVVLAALEQAGYTATVETHHPHQRVLIDCAGDRDAERARVRAVIESADVTAPDDGAPVARAVRFRDE